MAPSLSSAVLHNRCPVIPSGRVSLITLVGCFRGVSCMGCMCLLVVVEPWLPLLHQLMDWPSGWLAVRISHNHSIWAAVQDLTCSGICPIRFWCLPRPLFRSATMEWIRWYAVVVWSLPAGILILVPLERDPLAGQCQTLPVSSPGLPVSRCNVIYSW